MANAVFPPQSAWLDYLAALVAAAAPLNGALLHLYKVNINPGNNTTIADMTAAECDFSGYAVSSPIVWGTPFYDPNGIAVVTGGLKVFTTTSPASVLNTVYGWYVTDAGSTALLLARKLDTPVILTQAFQSVEVVPCFPVYLPV